MGRKLLITLVGSLLLTGCLGTRYISSGVNKYGTQYVVTKTGDTIFRASGDLRINQGVYPPQPFFNPYWNNNVWGPRIIITPRRTNPKRTSNVSTPRGSRGTTPSTQPRPNRGNRQ